MFEQTFLTPSNKGTRFWTTAVSVSLQVLFVLVMVLVPMVMPDSLPRAMIVAGLMSAPPPPAPPRAPDPYKDAVKVVDVKWIPREYDGTRLLAPARIPDKVAVIDDSGLPPMTGYSESAGVPGGIGTPSGAWDRFVSAVGGFGVPAATPPPAPPPAEPKVVKQTTRIRVGGVVQEAMILKRAMPVYPQLARQARVSGTVRLLGIISTDGSIQQLQVISGHPLLIQAAMDAVLQWRYRPTMLNGEAVEVVAPIEVKFNLNG